LLTIQFRASKPDVHEQAVRAAEACRNGGLLPEPEGLQPELEWRVRETGVAYVGTEPWGMHHHTWRIQEVERSRCSLLRVNNATLEPYDYAETADASGIVTLVARAHVDDQTLDALSALHFSGTTVDVVREGITTEPRRMRIDAYVWAPGVVVVRCSDAAAPRVSVDEVRQPDDLRALISALGSVIDANALRATAHQARRVSDPDSWPL
jgi:hypothetical protein